MPKPGHRSRGGRDDPGQVDVLTAGPRHRPEQVAVGEHRDEPDERRRQQRQVHVGLGEVGQAGVEVDERVDDGDRRQRDADCRRNSKLAHEPGGLCAVEPLRPLPAAPMRGSAACSCLSPRCMEAFQRNSPWLGVATLATAVHARLGYAAPPRDPAAASPPRSFPPFQTRLAGSISGPGRVVRRRLPAPR